MARKKADEPEKPKGKSPAEWAAYWQKEMDAAKRRQQKFIKQGNGVVNRFRQAGQFAETHDDTVGPSSLNLFWSNITTLQSMLYGATPKIEVEREHHDPDDDVARVACLLFERILQADVEESGKGFPTVLKAALQDRLLPGLGVARVSYEMKAPNGEVEYEGCCVDYVHWQDFRWGWARTWAEVPWIGFCSWLTKKEVKARFGAKIADSLQYSKQNPESDDTSGSNDDKDNVQKAPVWDIWSKSDKKVYYWSPGCDTLLDVTPDPMGLQGFWPIPMPMVANITTSLFMPKADYCMAQDLYNEIDVLQTRISNITRAIKVVGVYDSSASTSVGRMLTEGVENQLIPVDSWAMFAERGGLKGTIDWFPVQDVVTVLDVLSGQRENAIALLHEITGQSDIIRGGNTDQYTSDGTNQLKAKFGSIRIQALQDEFARFASDLDALKAEVIAKLYSPATIVQHASAQFLPEPDRLLVPQALQLMKSPDIKWRVNIRPESIAMIDYAQLKSERTEYLNAMATFIQSAQAMVAAVPGSLPVLLEFMKFGLAGFKGSNSLEGILDRAIEMAIKSPPQGDNGQAEQARQQGEMAKIEAKHKATMDEIAAKNQAEMQKLQLDGANNLKEILAKAQGDMQKMMGDFMNDMKIIAAKRAADLDIEAAQSGYAIAESDNQLKNDKSLIEAQPRVTQ